MFDDVEKEWQESIDLIDVKYIDGTAYMSVHTVDLINQSLLEILDATSKILEEDQGVIDTIGGALWVMNIWKDVHDELDLRAEVKQMPDTVPTDLLEQDD